MTFRPFAAASAAVAIAAYTAATRPAPAEPLSVVAPCRSPLGRHVVVTEPGAQRSAPPSPYGPADMSRDPAELTLPALFLATPIVVQGRVAHVGSTYATSAGGEPSPEMVDVDLDVDEVVKNLSSLPLARHAPLRGQFIYP